MPKSKLSDGRAGWIAEWLLDGSNLPSPQPREADTTRPHNTEKAPEIPAGRRQIVGYYTEDYPGDPTSYGSLLNNQSFLDSIAIFSHPVSEDGRVLGATSDRAMKIAKSADIGTLSLVHNIVGAGLTVSVLTRYFRPIIRGRKRFQTSLDPGKPRL